MANEELKTQSDAVTRTSLNERAAANYRTHKAIKEAESKILNQSKSQYDPQKRREIYERAKAAGKPQAYYKKKMEEDPMFNRKAHIRRKAADPEWQTKRGRKNNKNEWEKIIAYIRESTLSEEDLATALSEKWTLFRRTPLDAPARLKTSKTVYRPRIINRLLTDEEIRELNDTALSKGLATEVTVLKTSVKYAGEMGRIDDLRDENLVDIYTLQGEDEEPTGGGVVGYEENYTKKRRTQEGL